MDAADDRLELGLHLVHQLHRLEDAEGLALGDDVALLDERRRVRLRRAVEGADHRRLDADEAVRRRRAQRRRTGLGQRERRAARDAGRRLGRGAHGDAHPVLLDRDLADPGLLDDADELADPLRARLLDRGEAVLVAAGAVADGAEQVLRVLAEQAEQEQLLLAGGHALGLLPDLVQRRGDVLLGLRVGRERDGALHRRVDRPRRRAEVAGEQSAQLVHDGQVAARGEDVEQRLRREHLADRRRQRRPAGLGADLVELLEHLLEPVARVLGAQRRVDARDEARGDVVLRRADGDPRRERRHRLVADVLVDEIAGAPERGDVDAGVEPHPGERLGQRLAGDAVERECERIDGAGDQLRARPGRPRASRRARCRRRPGRRSRSAGRSPRRARRRAPPRGAAAASRSGSCRSTRTAPSSGSRRARSISVSISPVAAGAVDEPGLEVALRGDDRLGGLAQVGDVVERVVEPEDVDPVVGGRGDEAAGEVRVDGARPDEEAAAQGEPERRLRPRLQRPDPLPRALDAALDGGVEAAAARDLEVREAGGVEDLGQIELVGGRHPPGERLLPEQANGRVGELRHDRDLTVVSGTPPGLGPGDVAHL